MLMLRTPHSVPLDIFGVTHNLDHWELTFPLILLRSLVLIDRNEQQNLDYR